MDYELDFQCQLLVIEVPMCSCRFEEARELRQELNNAIQMKNFKTIKDLTDKGLRQFSTLLELTLET